MNNGFKIDDYLVSFEDEASVEKTVSSTQSLVAVIENDKNAIANWKKSKLANNKSIVTFILCDDTFPENYEEISLKYPNLIAISRSNSSLVIQSYISTKLKAREIESLKANYEKEMLKIHSMKESFMSNITHELRTPLNTILGYSEIVGEDLKDGDIESISEYVSYIMEAGIHLKTTIENILHYISLENAEAEMHPEDLSRGRSSRYSIQICDQTFRQSKNEHSFEIEKDFDYINIDRERLYVLLNIIIDNANKFTESGVIDINVISNANFVHFEINDTGIGFDKSILDELTQPFTQEASQKSRKFGGLGLGLSLGKRIIRVLRRRACSEF